MFAQSVPLSVKWAWRKVKEFQIFYSVSRVLEHPNPKSKYSNDDKFSLNITATQCYGFYFFFNSWKLDDTHLSSYRNSVLAHPQYITISIFFHFYSFRFFFWWGNPFCVKSIQRAHITYSYIQHEKGPTMFLSHFMLCFSSNFSQWLTSNLFVFVCLKR